jgi:hypothetical protein
VYAIKTQEISKEKAFIVHAVFLIATTRTPINKWIMEI